MSSRRLKDHGLFVRRHAAARLLVSSLLFFLLVPALAAQSGGYSKATGIEYMRGAKGPLLADAYVPKGKGPFPAVLYIHGGAWMNGNRNQMLPLAIALVHAGYVAVTIEYDVDPVPYPNSFEECLEAVRFMRRHAKELHIDPNHIAVAGSSAGGELAALVALNPSGKTLPNNASGNANKEDARVQAAIILNGVLDLQALGDKSTMVTHYLGSPCSTRLVACRDASPVDHVHPGAPPFFVGHGTADEIVPFEQAQRFTKLLQQAGVPVTPFIATGGPHTYWVKKEFFDDNLRAVKKFLQESLGTSNK